ncbi:MAG: hypothetical protein OXH75_23305, partial [Acidobacteria bacterium]|nr:hypothetical protein [Acidobacteriota bacterium]
MLTKDDGGGRGDNSGLPQDAIRSVLNGHVPRLNRVEQICRALGLEFYIGPPRDVPVEADGVKPSRPLTRFHSSVQLPVRVLSPSSPEVCLMESEEADQARPAPVDLDDPQAFYALFHGYSMVPTGIGPADFCLVSPCAKLEPGQRIWLRDRRGREGLRWLIRLAAASYEVAAWQPPKPNGHQDLVPERWERKDVDDRGVILAVYRGWVVPSDPVHRLPDWHPGRLTGLWRALFDDEAERRRGHRRGPRPGAPGRRGTGARRLDAGASGSRRRAGVAGRDRRDPQGGRRSRPGRPGGMGRPQRRHSPLRRTGGGVGTVAPAGAGDHGRPDVALAEGAGMNRLLVALTVLASVWLWRPFPPFGADPVADLIAVRSPGLHGLIRAWHYLGPAIAAVIAWSVAVAAGRVWFAGRPRGRVRGRLPAWPVDPGDPAPAIVVGEMHHPVAVREV